MRFVLWLACGCTILSCTLTQAAHAQADLNKRLRDALEQLRLGNHSVAHDLAVSVARASTDPRFRAQSWQLLAHVYQRSGMPAQALRSSEEFLKLADRPEARNDARLDSDLQQMAVLAAEVNAQLGRYPTAVRWYEFALRIPRGARLSEPVWEAATQLSWAKAALAANQSDKSNELYRAAAANARRVLKQIDQRQVPAINRPEATRVFVAAAAAIGQVNDAKKAVDALLATNPKAEARRDALDQLADVLRGSGSHESEIDLLRKMLAEKSTDKQPLAADRARVFERLAAALKRQADGEPNEEKANELRRQARAELESAAAGLRELCNAPRDTDTPFDLAENLQRWHDVSVELETWEQAREAAEKLLELRRMTLLRDDPAIFRARRSLGVALARCERFKESAEHLDLAIEFWKRYQPAQLLELSDTRQNRAETARKQGHYDIAAEHLREVLYLLDATDPGDQRVIETQVTLGNVLSAKADYRPALAAYQAAVAACQQASHPSDRVKELHALGLLGRATIYKTQLWLDEAIADCQAALAIYGAKADRESAVRAQVLVTLASLHLARYAWKAASPELSDLPQARQYIDQAQSLCEGGIKLDSDSQCQMLHVLGLTSFREAQAQFRPGGDDDRDKARASCMEAIQHWRAARELADGKLPAVTARVTTYLAEAQLLASKLPPEKADGYAAAILADAAKDAQTAVELLDRLQAFPAMHYRALLTSAKIAWRQREEQTDAKPLGDPASRQDARRIEELLRAAVEIVDEPRSNCLGTERDRAEFFSQFVEAYELLITCLVEQGRYDEAVACSQISRNRTFLEQVELTHEDLRKELIQAGKEQLLDELQSAIQDSDRLRQQIQEVASKPLVSETDRARHEADVRKLRETQERCDRLCAEIRAASTSFGNLLKGGLTEDDWREARKKVVGSDGLLLAYHLGPTASELFVVSPERVDCLKLEVRGEAAKELGLAEGPLTGAVALDLVNRYLQCPPMQESRSAPRMVLVGEPLSDSQAARLSEIVLPEQVRSELRKRRPRVVTVAPDGALHRLPLEALPLDKTSGKYVLDDPEIPPFAYAPSAMVMAALQPDAPHTIAWPPAVLTVGDAQYARADLKPLPRSADECRGWERLLSDGGTRNVQTLLQASATERNVRANVDGRRLVHFAVHGVVDDRADSVFAASLALTPGAPEPIGSDKPAADDDGFLNLSEVYRLPLAQCEVAVISACESNVGHTRKLEAGSTLTRAFLSAGARRVVASMWRVDDQATAALMTEFAAAVAESIRNNQPPNYAEALQRARHRVRADKEHTEWHRPHYWAPFVLIGPPT